MYSSAAVAAPHYLAAEAGRDTLAQGGNAIEAMVAMAATISVVYPHANSIGGDGFWVIRDPKGKVRALEACGFAGALATIDRYRALELDAIPPRGPNAALTVPGAVGGWALALELAHALGGRMPLSILLERAVSHARQGVPVSKSEARFDPTAHPLLMAAPGFASTFLVDGKPAPAGTVRKLPRLADSLAHLGQAGLDDFYRGDIAREIATDLEKLGSPVTRADFKAYSARIREPLSLRIEGARLYNTPPPTQGLASLIMLGLYERLAPRSVDGFDHAHALIEAFKRAARIRDLVCVDFDLATANFAQILSSDYLDREAAKIDKTRAAPMPLPDDQGDTVWMGAIDRDGLSVSFIQSVYWEFGSGCVLDRTGITMQNRGLALTLEPGTARSLKPGRRPFHTLNPAMAAFDDGRTLVYGSMGGDGQPQFQAQVFTRIAAGQKLADAVAAPRMRYGRTWGEQASGVKVEASYDDAVFTALARAGHEIERRCPEDVDSFGHAGAIMRFPKGNVAAAHDPRSDGGAEGL